MKLNALLDALRADSGYADLRDRLVGDSPKAPARFSVLDAAKPALIAALHGEVKRPTILLVSRLARARQLVDELKAWCDDAGSVLLFPELDALPYERLFPGSEHLVRRLQVLLAMTGVIGDSAPLIVVTARAAMDRLMAPDSARTANWRLVIGDELRLDDFLGQLVRFGYEPVQVVAGPGEFARRGGILDISPFGAGSSAFRLELEGRRIDSMREVDLATQRSVDFVDEIVLGPAHEVLPTPSSAALAELNALSLGRLKEKVRAEIESELESLRDGHAFPLLEWYRGALGSASILDYLPNNGLLVVDEPGTVTSTARELERQAEFLSVDLLERGEAPPHMPRPYFTWDELAEGPLNRLHHRAEFVLDPDALDTAFTPAPSWSGHLPELVIDLARGAARSRHMAVVTQQSARIEELLTEAGADIHASEEIDAPESGQPMLALVHGSLSEGWTNESAGITLLTDRELFGWAKVHRGERWRAPIARERFLSDLEEGELVVHMDHGIGRYRGLVRIADAGTEIEREYLDIEYADRARLRVPAEQAAKVTRYMGSGEVLPSLSSLGAGDWQRTKRRIRAAVQRIAKELVELYARRELAEGRPFGPDNQWQMELEASFPFVETPDQLQAVLDVKADLQKNRPMDRLLVGDVGYGKTEVALRAAFKAVTEGKQVAVLVPTTVLAQQHFTTFRERLAPFPVRVEVLSRFLSDAQARQVIADTKEGKVDILIGTHRLLQADVDFPDLGLLVIDEEQRFGVAHKERFKELRTEVHVLTLSATPIPRTLHLSLVGVRDLSMIQTAPEDRLPIRTYVTEHDEGLIREAILRELDRGGQIYFVSNRVHSIVQVAARISALVPEARVGVAHGQMADEELEMAMLAFVNDEIDVLVCTTIIEAGLDLPNVNTIIVEDAQLFGLSQMYQLRGRVGRGADRAYAYFLYPKDRQLTEIAEKRLRAIFEASELGAGYRIALKDLEIRGAGNLLGTEQHGQIAAVGFDLYCKLLGEAVQQLKGLRDLSVAEDGVAERVLSGALLEERTPTISLPISSFLPATYVEDEAVRLNLYQRLGAIRGKEELEELAQELWDRFGRPPRPASGLLALAGLRVGAIACEVKDIGIEQGELVIRFWDAHYVNGYELGKKLGRQVMTKVNQIRMPVPDRNQLLPTVRDTLEFLSIAPVKPEEPVGAKA